MSVTRRLSQRDLARIAKVSHTTVSLALRDDPTISKEVRDRIRAIAVQNNYRPDPALAALNAYRLGKRVVPFQGNIAWITNFEHKEDWRRMIQAEGYFEGARKRAQELGYNLEEFWVGNPKLSARRASQILISRGVRGIVVAPLPAAGEIALEWDQFSSVAMGYSLTKPKLHMVMNHQSRNMRILVARLAEMGYRRIGLAMPGHVDSRVDHSYLAGFWIGRHLQPADAKKIPELLAENFDEKTLGIWYDANKPDVIITSATSVYKVIDWLHEKRLHVPRDVGVAVAATPFGDSVISGVSENVHMIGAMAVDAVVAMIHRNETGVPAQPTRTLAEGVWSPGNTISVRKPASEKQMGGGMRRKLQSGG
ncbi:LacI family transcriptional regulator [Termitidicoccus mucosus]|uniref:LacI family transcriptional regulator n=1 Tax=Termitidicoccus mucosus TaxID=1184151 RepID=A0A178IL44_9BACT|nr:LacI family transcriptional regulator [Opitutaceae bacterium TSB47]